MSLELPANCVANCLELQRVLAAQQDDEFVLQYYSVERPQQIADSATASTTHLLGYLDNAWLTEAMTEDQIAAVKQQLAETSARAIPDFVQATTSSLDAERNLRETEKMHDLISSSDTVDQAEGRHRLLRKQMLEIETSTIAGYAAFQSSQLETPKQVDYEAEAAGDAQIIEDAKANLARINATLQKCVGCTGLGNCLVVTSNQDQV
jgi:Spy/CpxP family protein refolding chaperone